MTVPARLSIVTLGVVDLERSVAFYEALGWERCDSSSEAIAWFRTADTNVGLFPWGELAEDARLPAEPRARFGGITLAINVDTPPSAWTRIKPCGLSCEQLSVARAAGRSITVEDFAIALGPRVVAALAPG